MRSISIGIVTCVSCVLALVTLQWWLATPPNVPMQLRLPDETGPVFAGTGPGPGESGPASGFPQTSLERGTARPPPWTGLWPAFRGPERDNTATDAGLPVPAWTETPPALRWSVSLGEGHAGPAVHDGRVYVLDYDETRAGDALRCLALDSGAEIWRRWYPNRVKRNHGMSRTVPAVTENWVVTLGPKCHVMCVRTETGDLLWGMDLVTEYGTTVPLWYTGQCPLIDEGQAILAPAGRAALLIGVDCATGTVAWETPNPREWQMSHASVMPMEFEGHPMYVYCAQGGMVGVSAAAADRGRVLWETTAWNHRVAAPSPVQLDGNRIFITSGHGAGSMVLQLAERGDGTFDVSVETRFDKAVFASEQQTPIYHRGHLFAVLPKDAGERRMQFACFNPAGDLVWASGKENRFGLGPFLLADDQILLLNDDGILHVLQAGVATGYRELASAQILSGRDAWAPLALVNGLLLARDSKTMVCLDLTPDRERPAGNGPDPRETKD